MVHYRCDPGNTCGTFHVVHLGRYALGGFGLVFVEATAVEQSDSSTNMTSVSGTMRKSKASSR